MTDEPRNRYHHGDLAAALKSEAVRLIAKHGVEGFSLREAAVAVRVSPSAAYRHFANKIDLLMAVADDAFDALATAFQVEMDAFAANCDPEKSTIERFKAMFRAYVRFALDNPARFQVMFSLSRICQERRAAQAAMQGNEGDQGRQVAAAYQTLRTALDDLRAAGIIEDTEPEAAAMVAWSAIHGFASLILSGLFQTPTAEALDKQTDELALRVVVALGPKPVLPIA